MHWCHKADARALSWIDSPGIQWRRKSLRVFLQYVYRDVAKSALLATSCRLLQLGAKLRVNISLGLATDRLTISTLRTSTLSDL